MSSVALHDQFKGAIAGAILGYLTGLHYQGLHLANQHFTLDAPLDLSTPLDLTWLAFSPSATLGETSQALGDCNYGTMAKAFLSMPFLRWMDGASMESSACIPEAMVPILFLLNQLESLLDNQSPSPFYGVQPWDDIQSLPEASHGKKVTSPSQISFSLLPYLLFHHDNPEHQKDGIEEWLRYCNGPTAWTQPLQSVGRLITQSIHHQPLDENNNNIDGINVLDFNPSDFESEPTPSHPFILVGHSAFPSINYQSRLLFCIRQVVEKKHWATLPLSTGLTGALIGARLGFSCLPLVWRYLFNQYLRVSPSSHESEPVLDWNIKMVNEWSGVHIYRKGNDEGLNITMASKARRYPTASMPQRRGL